MGTTRGLGSKLMIASRGRLMNAKILALGIVVAAALGSAGCSTEAFCFSDCTGPGTASGGTGGTATDGSGGGGGTFITDGSGGTGAAGASGASGQGGCQDTQNDPQNCGSCGHHCIFYGAVAKCVAGTCEFDSCATG